MPTESKPKGSPDRPRPQAPPEERAKGVRGANGEQHRRLAADRVRQEGEAARRQGSSQRRSETGVSHMVEKVAEPERERAEQDGEPA